MRMPWTAEARLARSEKGLSSALAGQQTLGDGIGLVTSHMFGGAVVGGGGNVALHANSGDKVNGTANYGSAFVSGAIGGAVAGGAAGVYRARGAKKFSEARVAKATEKYEKSFNRFADKKDASGHSINELGEMYKDTKQEARETRRRRIADPLKGPGTNEVNAANNARRNTKDVVMDRLNSADISDASRKRLKQGIFTSKVQTNTPLINPRQAVNSSYGANGVYSPNNAVQPIVGGGFDASSKPQLPIKEMGIPLQPNQAGPVRPSKFAPAPKFNVGGPAGVIDPGYM